MMAKNKLITIGSAVVALVAVGAVILLTAGKDEPSSSVADMLESVTEAPTEATLPDITDFTKEPELLGRAKTLLRENEDVVGYIKINNTNVDYPVVQYDGEDLEENGNDYYLHRDLYGEYLESGTIFMDYRDVFGADESQHSENIVLYGHNMLNGSKFATLHYYREDESFYEENPIIEFSSNYKDYKYVIFGVVLTSGSYGDSNYGEEWAYWDQEDLSNKEDFDKYVDNTLERSLVSTDVDVEYGDQLLTLSTCWLDSDNSRLLIIARRLHDDEKPEDFMKPESADNDDSESDGSGEE